MNSQLTDYPVSAILAEIHRVAVRSAVYASSRFIAGASRAGRSENLPDSRRIAFPLCPFHPACRAFSKVSRDFARLIIFKLRRQDRRWINPLRTE